MKKFIFILLIPILCFAEIIGREEFIKLAQENDPEFKLLNTDSEKVNFLVDQGLPTRSLLMTIRKEYGFSSQGKTENLATVLDKNILESGTNLRLSQTKTTRPDRSENVLQFRIEQALLNNSFGRNLRLKKEILEDEVKKLQLELLEIYESYINDIGKIYYTYAESFFNYQLAKQILQESQELLNNIEAKKKKSIATQIDLDRVTLQYLNSKEDYIEKKNQYDKNLISIEVILGKKVENLDPELSVINFNLNKVDELNPDNLRVFQREKIDNTIQHKLVKLAERADSAELDLILGYNRDKSTRFNTPINREEKVVGLELNIPFGDTQSQAGIAEARLMLKKSDLNLQILRQDLMTNFLKAKEEIKQLQEVLEISQKKRDLAQRILKTEEQRYQYGNQTLEKLIETKKEFSQYRFNYYSALIAFNKKVLEWKNFNDMLY